MAVDFIRDNSVLLKCLPVILTELHVYVTERSWRTSTGFLWDGFRAGIGQLVLVAAAIRLQLSEGKQGMEMLCVDVRSLAPTVSLCVSVFLLFCAACCYRCGQRCCKSHPSTLTFLPLPWAVLFVSNLCVSLWEISFPLVRLSTCLERFLCAHTSVNGDWQVG